MQREVNAESGRPLLGICVGMQILFDGSEEFGETQGLGIIAGRVVAVPPALVAVVTHTIVRPRSVRVGA